MRPSSSPANLATAFLSLARRVSENPLSDDNNHVHGLRLSMYYLERSLMKFNEQVSEQRREDS